MDQNSINALIIGVIMMVWVCVMGVWALVSIKQEEDEARQQKKGNAIKTAQ